MISLSLIEDFLDNGKMTMAPEKNNRHKGKVVVVEEKHAPAGLLERKKIRSSIG